MARLSNEFQYAYARCAEYLERQLGIPKDAEAGVSLLDMIHE